MSEYKPEIVECTGNAFDGAAARLIWRAAASIRNPLLTLPTGSTPLGMHRRLVRDHGTEKKIWRNIRFVSLDEYIGLPPEDERLFARWLGRELLDPAGVPQSNRMIFNSLAADPSKEAARMEQWIADNGPIDIAVLGLGENGHIAFNEPGSAFESITRAVRLSPETRSANAKYWGALEKVPEEAYTLGLKTLTSARQIFLLVSGAHKAAALEATLNGKMTPDIPASILRSHPRVTVIADRAALGR